MTDQFPAQAAYFANSATIVSLRARMNTTFGPARVEIIRQHQAACDRIATLYPALIAENRRRLDTLAGR